MDVDVNILFLGLPRNSNRAWRFNLLLLKWHCLVNSNDNVLTFRYRELVEIAILLVSYLIVEQKIVGPLEDVLE